MSHEIRTEECIVVNHGVRRAGQGAWRSAFRWACGCAVALALCTPALLADAFDPGGHGPFQKSNLSAAAWALDIQALVDDFQTSAQRSQAVSRRANSRARRASFAVENPDPARQSQQSYHVAAASLAAQLIGVDASTRFGRSQSGAVNSALWNLILRPASSYGASSSQAGGTRYPAQAQSGKGHRGIAGLNVWKPEPKGRLRGANVRVPEPSLGSLLVFHAVALALAGFCLRRRGIGFVP